MTIQWIASKDRLPEDDRRVLVCQKDQMVEIQCVCRKDNSLLWFPSGYSTEGCHWAELPDPPGTTRRVTTEEAERIVIDGGCVWRGKTKYSLIPTGWLGSSPHPIRGEEGNWWKGLAWNEFLCMGNYEVRE
jgi:hypothetical protein